MEPGPMMHFGGDWIPGSFSDNVTGSWGISWCFVRARPHHDPQPNKAHSQQIPYFPVSTRKTLRCTSYNNILGISENEGPQKHPLKYVEFLSHIAHIFDFFRFTKENTSRIPSIIDVIFEMIKLKLPAPSFGGAK